MKISFAPRERRFFELFDQQASTIKAAAAILVDVLTDPTDITSRRQEIRDLEHAGDEITHELVRTLNRTFVTPFDREDIYALASGLDDILDYIDEIVDIIILYDISPLPGTARELGTLIRDACSEVQLAVGAVSAMRNVEQHGIEVHRLENEGDRLSRHAIGDLFRGDHSPLNVIKLKELFTLLEDALDRCEDVANIIESIVIKNA
jgi:uncharacterized protein Yka (UPF0111/DUF47 family)